MALLQLGDVLDRRIGSGFDAALITVDHLTRDFFSHFAAARDGALDRNHFEAD